MNKSRWVKDGHRTPDPENFTFTGVISRESVWIALNYTALNNIDVITADIKNGYLQAPSSDGNYIICGPEFRLAHVGKVAHIWHALYGVKYTGDDFWKYLRICMNCIGFELCKSGLEICVRPAQKYNWVYLLVIFVITYKWNNLY